MGVIVGAGTTTSFENAISVNWGASPNTQRLYVLGSSTAFITVKKPTATLSVTLYSPGSSYSVTASDSCSAASTVPGSVTPGACGGCGGGGEGVGGDWYLTSYSYSKDDPNVPGQESLSMMQYLTGNGVAEPKVVIRGIAEGSWTPGAGIGGSADSSSSTGSVSAGGIGRADTLNVGTVSSVGGGSAAVGATGQGSASIPYTPIYC